MPEEEFLEGDDAEAERRRLERQEKAAAKKQQRLLQHVDPELVDSHFLRPHDHTIRATDLPERLQLLGKPVLEVRLGVWVWGTVCEYEENFSSRRRGMRLQLLDKPLLEVRVCRCSCGGVDRFGNLFVCRCVLINPLRALVRLSVRSC
jgi:hypothetical protein